MKNNILLAKLIIFSLMICAVSEARVYNMQNETLASYFVVNGGTSVIGTTALDKESTATSYSSSITYNLGGEFGLVYTSSRLALRLAFEILQPDKIKGANASLSGSTLYSVDSELLGYAPKIGAEFHIINFGSQRFYLIGSVGSANVTMKNTYSSVTISPNTSFTTEAKGTGNLVQAGLGYEIYLFDTTTFVLEANYRTLTIDNYTYTKDVTTFTGSKVSGNSVLNTAGNKRSTDFTGVYASLGFRFWL